ncbi:hypothetical protein HJFPF1_13387 [Paramyrothecium foliicola]|nr:hypothetical protein HJFPF1_13387 [Paramyrothecium foliicola]
MAPAWLEKHIVRVDATPDPKRSTEQPAFELKYTALEDHRRVVGVVGEERPRYEVTRRSILAAWGDKSVVTSTVGAVGDIATIDFRSLPSAKIEIKFTQHNREITIRQSQPHFESSGGLGNLRWKPTGMAAYRGASWELRDEHDLVMSVVIDDRQTNGTIDIWKDKLDPETMEELVIVAISQLEHYKRMNRNAMTSAAGVVIG